MPASTKCGWCGGPDHPPQDCPVAQDYQSQLAMEQEALGGYEEATPLEKQEFDGMASSNT